MPAKSSCTCSCRIEVRKTKSYGARLGELGRQPDDRAAGCAAPARSRRAASRPNASRPVELDGEVQALVEHARERVRRDRARSASAPASSRGRSSRAPTRVCAAVELAAAQELDALRARGRAGSISFSSWYWRATSSCAMRLIAWNTSRGGHAVRAAAGHVQLDLLLARPATRISKNSSRFDETMHRKRSRSSSGTAGVLGLREHAALELEDAELAVEEMARDVPGDRGGP